MKTIQVDDHTHADLKSIGKKDESFDSIIRSLLPPKDPAGAIARLNDVVGLIFKMRPQAHERWVGKHRALEALPESTPAVLKKIHEDERDNYAADETALDQAIAALKARLASWPPG